MMDIDHVGIEAAPGGEVCPEGMTDDIDAEFERLVALYEEKNSFLRGNPNFREIKTWEFLLLLFCRGDFDELPFEEEWCESYDWWADHNTFERQHNRPPQFDYVYNGIAQAIYGHNQEEKNRTFVITSQAEQLRKILEHPFVLMSPISYTGKRRTKNNARYLYAIGIDIDNVDAQNIENLLYQSDPSRKYITFPQPQIIVNSGGGIHIYYLLESPAPMFKDSYPILNKIKKELTRRVWNKGTTHEDPDKPQYQGNCQGFRLPGTQTKTRRKVTVFQNLTPHIKPYYSISDLVYGGGGFLTDQEVRILKKGTYDPKRVSLARARELYPEWYERRIIQKVSNRWYVNRALYDWWKSKIIEHATVGHRYFCLMVLAIYAMKCKQMTIEQFKSVYAERLKGLSEKQILNRYKKKKGVTEEEFRKDLMDFVPILDGLSVSRRIEDRFTMEDASDAADAYKESYCTFPMADLRDITGIDIERNQRRKFKDQTEHLIEARAIRDSHNDRRGHNWNTERGRKPKYEIILKWKQEHPGGTRYACAKDLGISQSTAARWWETTTAEIEEYKEQRTLTIQKRIAEERNTSIEGYHSVGSAGNSSYIMDKKAILQILRQIPEYETYSEHDQEEILYDLTDIVNWSDTQLEEIYKAIKGIPESVRPFVHVKPEALQELRDELAKPYDYSEDLKNLPELIKEWPEELQNLYRKQMEACSRHQGK